MDKKTLLNQKIIYYWEFRDMASCNKWVAEMTERHKNMELVASMIKKQERYLPTENPDVPPASEFIVVGQLEFSETVE